MNNVWDSNALEVEVKVNGEIVGHADGSEKLADVAKYYSTSHGLKTFNVLVNGSKADTSQGGKTLSDLGATLVELVAKDARG
jgi:hypothetical protein